MSAPQQNPLYLIVSHSTRHGLVALVSPKLMDGVWECVGAPFYDEAVREWAQAIVRVQRETPAGTVKLKEPKR